jgi:predicted transcriptional regulator of viral defense system
MKLATKLLNYIEEAQLCEFSMLKSLSLTSDNSLRVTLSRLIKSEDIYSPIKGIYVAKSADPFWVATSLYPGYISLSSAFYIYHLMDEYPFTIFVASEKRGVVHAGGHEFYYFKAKNYIGVDDKTYPIATVEKAVYDSLNHWNLIGYTKLAAVLYYSKIKSKKLFEISERENSAFFQKLGYLLSILPSIDREKKKMIEFCRKVCIYQNGNL